MDQVNLFSDSRLLNGCIYCTEYADTRDHVPSKCLLEPPYPTNLPVVGCCDECNQGFSRDEQYFACLTESILCGSTDPEKIARPSVAKIMRNSPALRARIEKSRTESNDQIIFTPEMERIENVLLKLARGHAAYELSRICLKKPNHIWFGSLCSLSQEDQKTFDSIHIQHNVGEVGSRNMQRLQVIQMKMPSEQGEQQNVGIVFNDWVDVQDDRYRFISIEDMGVVNIKIIIAEYFACQVVWEF